jgi:HSP20 family protein
MSDKSTETASREAKLGTAPVMAPPVDVYEDDSGILLFADMPGVSKESLSIRVDGDTLLIEGDIEGALGAEAEPAYAEVRGAHYRRSFSLSRELAKDRIDAVLKDGVLRVQIPKAQSTQPRRIEVRVG